MSDVVFQSLIAALVVIFQALIGGALAIVLARISRAQTSIDAAKVLAASADEKAGTAADKASIAASNATQAATNAAIAAGKAEDAHAEAKTAALVGVETAKVVDVIHESTNSDRTRMLAALAEQQNQLEMLRAQIESLHAARLARERELPAAARIEPPVSEKGQS